MARVGVAQVRAPRDKAKGLEAVLGHIGRAASMRCALVAFPEYMMFYAGGRTAREVAADAEPIDGPFVRAISRAARERRIHVIGTIYEKSARADRVYDTAFHVSPAGRTVATYQKAHLYDALGTKESGMLLRGRGLSRPGRTPAGTAGMLICYDLRFPEASRRLALDGAEVLVAPSAWVRGPGKESQWVALNRARAIENGCYVIAPAHVGNAYCGRSLAVDPTGRVLLDMKKRQGVATVDVSPSVVRRVRRAMPLLKSRRPDIY
ncbi:MAG: carbon-nitrogen hydrolase family protein [Thaumarchaeota archaeon]|nr:carbon-nitrogen hydrolase family protein [Nitrososphaerota archaeon]